MISMIQSLLSQSRALLVIVFALQACSEREPTAMVSPMYICRYFLDEEENIIGSVSYVFERTDRWLISYILNDNDRDGTWDEIITMNRDDGEVSKYHPDDNEPRKFKYANKSELINALKSGTQRDEIETIYVEPSLVEHPDNIIILKKAGLPSPNFFVQPD